MPLVLNDPEAEAKNDTRVNRYNKELLSEIILKSKLLLGNIGIHVDPEKIRFKVIDNQEMHQMYPTMQCAGLTQVISIQNHTHNIWLLEDMYYINLLATCSHEMGHTWCRDHQIKFTKMEEEGFCELIAYHVLKTQCSKIGSYYMKCMLNGNDPIYNDGLRHMKKQFEIFGSWFKFLGYIKLSRVY